VWRTWGNNTGNWRGRGHHKANLRPLRHTSQPILSTVIFFISLSLMRIYLDTSVIGGVFAKVFSADTKPMFDHIINMETSIIVSTLLDAELLRAPIHVRDYLKTLPKSQIERVELTEEAIKLADLYISEKVVGKTSLIDCQHIAIATICKADVLAN